MAPRPEDRARLPAKALLLVAASVLLVFGLAAPSGAASILSVGAAFGAGHGADLFDNTGPDRQERESNVSVVSSDATSFLTHFAATLAVDAEAGGSNQNLSFTVDYVVTVAIDAAVGETWELAVDNSRYGALTLVDDDNGRAQTQAQDVFVTVTGATLSSGTLDLGAAPNLNGGSGGYQDISQTTTGLLTGTGPGTVTLQFDFLLRAHTIPQGGAGDEASVRLGLPSTIDSFSAGLYAGFGGRSAAGDGHWVDARLVAPVSTPGPGTFVPVSLGLLGLARLGRNRERMSQRIRQPRGSASEPKARRHHSFARLRAVGFADPCWLANARRLAVRAFDACRLPRGI
jgi:hypothetical protein